MTAESKGKPNIWLFRHGLSVFNYWSRTFGHRAAEYGNVGTVEKDPDYVYLQDIKDKLDVRLADPALHKKGIAQAVKAQEKINKMNIKYVFVSPLRRTLETCKTVFATYPNRSNVTFKVNPLVRELMGSPCDVPVDTLTERRKEYEPLGFNFEMLDKFEKKDLFFLYSMNSPEREELFAAIEKHKSTPYIQVIANVIKKKRKDAKKGNRKIESFVNARERAVEFAEFLLNFIATAGLGEGDDIVIVTHSLFISYCIATYWTPDGSISVGNIPHCDPIAFDYNWILQLKQDFSSKRIFVLAMLKLLPRAKQQEQKKIEAAPEKLSKCGKGHKLYFARNQIGTYVCSQCKRAEESDKGRWHCLLCNQSVCIDCCALPVPDEATREKMCEFGHKMKLRAYEYPWESYKCKRCLCEESAKVVRWNCSYCTYDVCLKCQAT